MAEESNPNIHPPVPMEKCPGCGLVRLLPCYDVDHDGRKICLTCFDLPYIHIPTQEEKSDDRTSSDTEL